MYEAVKEKFPQAEFWSVVSLLSQKNFEGSVYPGAPFKNRERDFFYTVDTFNAGFYWPGKTVSHGLIHADHSALQYDAQEMSIMTSCRYLGSDTFVPPFNRYNETTEAVCRVNKINLIRYEDGWRNLDHEDFDPSHRLWYFHPWRHTPESFKEKLNNLVKQGVL